jgi:hypothetical protein
MESKPNAAEKCNEVGWIWRKNLPYGGVGSQDSLWPSFRSLRYLEFTPGPSPAP